jgi:phage tail-like protein
VAGRVDGSRKLNPMNDTAKNNYLYLNRDGRWPGFHWDGLELRHDGALQLSQLPLRADTLPDSVKSADAPAGPAGLAIDVDGTLYFSDPAGNRVSRISGCDGSITKIQCAGGRGGYPSQFQSPRGLLIPRNRKALCVADSGNHRIQIFDLDTFEVVDIWGRSNPASPPQPGSLPGQFNTPWTLAADSSGNIYVTDYGNKRIQKFNGLGDVVPSFCDHIQAAELIKQPADIAVAENNGATWIFVLDVPAGAPASLFVFDSEGNPIKDSGGHPLSLQDVHLQQPIGLAISGTVLYVGDNSLRRVFQFQFADGFSFVGEAIGYEGPVAALLLTKLDDLWVHAGLSISPIKLSAKLGFRTQGVFFGDYIQIAGRSVVWHRLQALLESLAANAHLELFAYATNDPADKPAVAPGTNNPFADSRWQPVIYSAHTDVTDLYIGGVRRTFLWIGALFSGDGAATPVLNQLRIEFDHPSYDQYLPAVYRNSEGPDEFLVRLLSLFESILAQVEGEIDSLPSIFDPWAVPKSFLAWLGGCLGFELDDNWDIAKQRRLIAEIFRLYGMRGTPAGLREILRLFAGVDSTIIEPIQHAAWWSLPAAPASCCDDCAEDSLASGASWENTGNSVLGWTTMLAPAQPQGAVVGTSAVLDQSHLITAEQFGSPLFSDVAYQFSVQILRGQAGCSESIARVRAILDQEKPAHTIYHLCIVEPRMSVGFQCRLGVDTVVGGLPPNLQLGSARALGLETALPAPSGTRLSSGSRLGVSTRLS